MKTRKLLQELVDLLDGDRRRKKKERRALKEVLKKLKEKEKKLARDLEQSDDAEERNRMEKQLGVVHAQRKKGLKLLREE